MINKGNQKKKVTKKKNQSKEASSKREPLRRIPQKKTTASKSKNEKIINKKKSAIKKNSRLKSGDIEKKNSAIKAVPQKKKKNSSKKNKSKKDIETLSSNKKRNKGKNSFKNQKKSSLRISKKKKRGLLDIPGVRLARDIILATAVAFVLFIFIGSFFVTITSVDGYSMLPSLNGEDTIFVQKTKDVKRFNMVYFRQGSVQQVRRIIGMPGERIRYEDDILYVDEKPVNEKFIIDEINEAQRNEGQYTEDFKLQDIIDEQTIPEDCYLVLGDNREYGLDSRQYGLITRDQLIGIVKMRLLPINDLSAFAIVGEDFEFE